jgi:carboxymethylenebutenolidase
MMPTTASLIQIATADGPCTTEVVVPSGNASCPAVIVFFDAAGLRPAQTRIAERIASSGYLVFQPDLFHRSPPLTTLIPGPITLKALRPVFQDPALRTRFMTEYYQPALSYANLETTINPVLREIASHPRFSGGVGTTGYCMGGNASVRAATIFGKRIAATAAFHPGGLVTDQPDSPHLRAKSIQAQVYLGPATGDLPPEAEAKLRAELDAGSVRYQIEPYNAKHGYAVDDSDAFEHTASEQHYTALNKLFGQALPRGA